MLKPIKTIIDGLEKLTVRERSLFKLCLISFGLMLGALIPALMNIHWWIYGIIFAATDIYLMVRVFRR